MIEHCASLRTRAGDKAAEEAKSVESKIDKSLNGRLKAFLAVLLSVAVSLGMLPSLDLTSALAAGASAQKTVDVTFNKVWEGDADHQDARPSSVTLSVSNANTGAFVKEVTLTADGNWTATERLPYVTDAEGHLAYTVVEKKQSDAYDTSVQTMTNSTGKGLELWTLATGSRMADGAVVVLTNGKAGDVDLYKAEGPTQDVMSGTQYIITEPLTVDGTTYDSYCRIAADTDATVEDSLGWTVIAQGDGFVLQSNLLKADPELDKEGYVVINDKGEMKLTGSRDSATVFSFDQSTGALTASGTTLYGFAKTDDSSLADYISTVTITNTYVGSSPVGPTVEVGDGDVTLNATKTWDDDDDAAGARPDYVDLVVLANGQPAKDSDGNEVKVRVSADSDWKGTVEGLARYDADGNLIAYTLSEPNVPDGYTSTVGDPVVTEKDDKTYWVQATTFGTSKADEDTYLVVARDVDNSSKWLGMHTEGNTASWTNKEGHSASEIAINHETLKVTVDGETHEYASWISDEVAKQYQDCLWQTEYDGVDSDKQSGGTFTNFFLKNVKTGKYLKCNGQGDLVDSPKQGECSFHYGIPRTAKDVTLKNPKEEWPYVLGNMKHYYIVNNNHTGDGSATHASVVRIYKKIVVKEKTVDVTVSNSYKTPTGSITIKKIDQQGAKLSGAEFSLYCSSEGAGEQYAWNGMTYYKVLDATTDADGVAKFSDLVADSKVNYLLVETKAPQGYDPIDPVVFALPVARNGDKPADYTGNSTTADGVTYYYDVTYTAIDAMSVILPETAGPGILPFAFVGLVVMGLGAALGWSSKKSAGDQKDRRRPR